MSDGIDLTNNLLDSVMIESLQVNDTIFDSYYGDRKRKALRRQAFFEEDSDGIVNCLIEDLSKYLAFTDLTRIKMVAFSEFVSAFLKKITDIHNNPIHFKFKTGTDKKKIALFGEIMKTHINFRKFIPKNNRRTKLHGTHVVYVRFNERYKEVYFDFLHEGNCKVFTYPDYVKRPACVVYRGVDSEMNDAWIVWNDAAKEHYSLSGSTLPEFDQKIMDFKFDNKESEMEAKKPIGNNSGIKAPNYFPFVAYRYNDDCSTFWSHGYDSIIEIARMVNMLLTVTGDDSIQETMKLLLLNFNPNLQGGTKDKLTGGFKTGMANPFFLKNDGKGSARDLAPNVSQNSELSGEIVQGELYTEQILTFIQGITDMLSSLNNVKSIFSSQDMQRVYAEALREAKEDQQKDWEETVDLLMKQDSLLIQTVLDVYTSQTGTTTRFSKTFVKDNITMDYEKPKFNEDETVTLQREFIKWESGLSNPIKYYADSMNITEEQAEEDMTNNLAITKKFMNHLNLALSKTETDGNTDEV